MDVQSILEKLVSFPCLGGETNLEIIGWIHEFLHEKGIKTRCIYNDDKTKASIHCRIGPAQNGGIILSGHTDVVPVEGQDWSTKPFDLILKINRLYGRGSCDMKGFLACCLASVDQFKNMPLEKPVYFAFSHDEEIGCLGAPDLINDILDYYDETPAYAIIGEPTMMELVAGQKGICVMETHVNGSAGHSSRIKQEVSAIHEAARLICWLEDYMDTLSKEGLTKEAFDPNHCSIHIGKVKGGVAPNVIADSCRFEWDIRVIPGQDAYNIIDQFEDYCRSREKIVSKRFPGFKIGNKAVIKPVPGLDAFHEDGLIGFMHSLGSFDALKVVSYAAEAGQFAEAGIPSIICGPGNIEQAHRADEFIAISQLEECMKMLTTLSRKLSSMT